MGLIRTALLVGGGIYAVKNVVKHQEKKHDKQNNENNQAMYPYPASGNPSPPPPRYQQNPGYQPQDQGYGYGRNWDGRYYVQDYGSSYSDPQAHGQNQVKSSRSLNYSPQYSHSQYRENGAAPQPDSLDWSSPSYRGQANGMTNDSSTLGGPPPYFARDEKKRTN